MSIFNSVEGRITKEKVLRLLQDDPLLQNSIGVKKDYKILKNAGVTFGILMVILLATPLDQALFGRIGLALFATVVSAAWIASNLLHKIRVEEAAENLTAILREDPAVTITQGKKEITLSHKKFQARCTPMSQLKIRAMLDVEEEVKESVSALTRGATKDELTAVTRLLETPRNKEKTRP